MVHAANEGGARWKTTPDIFAGCGTNACQAVRSRITVHSWPPKGKKYCASDINDLLVFAQLPHSCAFSSANARAAPARIRRTFFRKEQARALKFDDFFAARNGIAQPTGPFHRKENVVGSPDPQGRRFELSQQRFNSDSLATILPGNKALRVARRQRSREQRPEIARNGSAESFRDVHRRWGKGLRLRSLDPRVE